MGARESRTDPRSRLEFLRADTAEAKAKIRCRCPRLNSVDGLVSLSAAGIGFVVDATEADALNPLRCGHG
jgi:hypothetical protein